MEEACFVKAYYRPFVGCDCSGYWVPDGRRWVGGGGGVGVVGVGWVVEHHRVQHGGVIVGTWCMCCVYKAKVFRKQTYRRFDEGQFTKVGCKTNKLKECIIVGCLGTVPFLDCSNMMTVLLVIARNTRVL